ncbi:DUF1572 family protein [Taibaiella soli]|uniref:DinB superfamily protein n=1 Tax=Taibaiella soli TaxID=1649169 RepID=A0A2W2BV03_9BACT|nr:DUF1572 family protein [Taibaiella soli]PZF71643.1 DinB superfamily protein [Taibaiella soli]
MTTEQYASLFKRELSKVIDELNQYQNDSDIWLVRGEIKNSAGHLCQHLVGNLKTFIGRELGGLPYERNRDAEFNERRFERPDLILLLTDTESVVEESLRKLSPAQLAGPYPPVLALAEDQTVDFVLTHLLAHLNYHLGQINYHRRLIN